MANSKKTSSWIKSIDPRIEVLKYARIFMLFSAAGMDVAFNQKLNTFPLMLYIITRLHDDDDKWLLDWIKWKIKQLTESLKWSKIKPITV